MKFLIIFSCILFSFLSKASLVEEESTAFNRSLRWVVEPESHEVSLRKTGSQRVGWSIEHYRDWVVEARKSERFYIDIKEIPCEDWTCGLWGFLFGEREPGQVTITITQDQALACKKIRDKVFENGGLQSLLIYSEKEIDRLVVIWADVSADSDSFMLIRGIVTELRRWGSRENIIWAQGDYAKTIFHLVFGKDSH
jgi:hypothetical protein